MWLRIGSLMGSFEYSNELAGTIKSGEFLVASRKELCSIEFITLHIMFSNISHCHWSFSCLLFTQKTDLWCMGIKVILYLPQETCRSQ
jgi:hypothetical protein